jgi:L-seryl-tRNA(Ser) seleniumtransferase
VGARRDASTSLRELPPVHELAAGLDAPHQAAVAAARAAIDEQREALMAGREPSSDLLTRARELLRERERAGLRRVLNATGVIVHTNLGRAPLAPRARDAVTAAADGYSNLEFDLAHGRRGERHAHVEGLLCELTGAEAAIAVNNGAGAVLLAVAALAGPGAAVIVSRGQLVEVGGGFRIPEVITQSGAEMIEVGTTNRTRLRDYEEALAAARMPVAAILRVHQSNFRAMGFVEEVPVGRLCALGIPVIDDVGSGVLADAHGIPALGDEPSIRRSIQAGAAMVCCSGDKLLGGPQAGVVVGRREAVGAARLHPLARALRIDKLSLAALHATLQLYRDPELARSEIPVLRMLDVPEQELARRAELLADGIGREDCHIVRAVSKVGGGALPLLELEGPAVALRSHQDPVRLATQLRRADPPVVGRIHDGEVLLDPRTLGEEELPLVAAAVRAARQSA